MKIMKLSLATAILVSAASSVNAQKLEEAIKNVDISGTAIYRYNDYQNNASTNYYKVGTDIKSSFADDVSFNTRLILGDNTAPIAFKTSNSSSDEDVDFTLSEINVLYTGIENTSIKLGKTAVDTPFTITRSSTGDEQTGTGIAINSKLGVIVLNGGYYNQTNFDKSGNVKSSFTNNKSGADFAYVGAKSSYKMFSNLQGYLMLGEYDVENNDKATIGRLNIQYSF